MIRPTVKTATIFGLMVAYGVESLLWGGRYQDAWMRRRRRTHLISRYSRWGLKVLGVKVTVRGDFGVEEASLLVGNHLSYLDVLVCASIRPSAFVTSEEVRQSPGLGWLCELGGCLFVERRTRARLKAEVGEIAEALRQGISVTVFPEATSTNGDEVLRFRRPLFYAASESQRPVVPFCLNYELVNGESLHRDNRDIVCWYGDMDFIPHLWKLAQQRSLQVRVEVGPALASTSPEELNQVAHREVAGRFQSLNKSKCDEKRDEPKKVTDRVTQLYSPVSSSI